MPVVKTNSPSPNPSAPNNVPSNRPPSANKRMPSPLALFGRFDLLRRASAASEKIGGLVTPWLCRPGANPEGPPPSIDISGIRYRPSIMLGDGFGWNSRAYFVSVTSFPVLLGLMINSPPSRTLSAEPVPYQPSKNKARAATSE